MKKMVGYTDLEYLNSFLGFLSKVKRDPITLNVQHNFFLATFSFWKYISFKILKVKYKNFHSSKKITYFILEKLKIRQGKNIFLQSKEKKINKKKNLRLRKSIKIIFFFTLRKV